MNDSSGTLINLSASLAGRRLLASFALAMPLPFLSLRKVDRRRPVVTPSAEFCATRSRASKSLGYNSSRRLDAQRHEGSDAAEPAGLKISSSPTHPSHRAHDAGAWESQDEDTSIQTDLVNDRRRKRASRMEAAISLAQKENFDASPLARRSFWKPEVDENTARRSQALDDEVFSSWNYWPTEGTNTRPDRSLSPDTSSSSLPVTPTSAIFGDVPAYPSVFSLDQALDIPRQVRAPRVVDRATGVIFKDVWEGRKGLASIPDIRRPDPAYVVRYQPTPLLDAGSDSADADASESYDESTLPSLSLTLPTPELTHSPVFLPEALIPVARDAGPANLHPRAPSTRPCRPRMVSRPATTSHSRPSICSICKAGDEGVSGTRSCRSCERQRSSHDTSDDDDGDDEDDQRHRLQLTTSAIMNMMNLPIEEPREAAASADSEAEWEEDVDEFGKVMHVARRGPGGGSPSASARGSVRSRVWRSVKSACASVRGKREPWPQGPTATTARGATVQAMLARHDGRPVQVLVRTTSVRTVS